MAFKKNIDYDGEIEMAVLGQALLEPRITARLITIGIKPEHFYYKSNQMLMLNLTEMHEKRIPIDLLTVHHTLLSKGIVEVGGYNTAYFLTRLTNRVVGTGHLDMHCIILMDMYDKRQLTILATKAANGASIDVLRKQANKVSEYKRRFTIKEARYLLKHVDKGLIKETAERFGSKTIKGHDKYRMRVSNEFLVYFMSLVEPYYTWTTQSGDEDFGPERVRASIVKGAILVKGTNGSTFWADPIYKYPFNL